MQSPISRRDILKGIALAHAIVLGGDIFSPTRAQGARSSVSSAVLGSADRAWYELGLMPDPIMDNQLLYYLSHAYQGMTDVGEVLDTAHRMDASDEYSWAHEWLKTADRVRGYAEASLAKGHTVSAGEAYLRASSYYRAALIHHPDHEDPAVPHATVTSMRCFNQALELLDIPGQPVQIPYEGTTLPGYFYRSSIAKGRAPLLIVFQGRDAWAEETRYLADAAVKRGYHCLQFQGPGQGAVLRLQGLPFRHDWEHVVEPVVDFALTLRGVDPNRIILKGLSFGGALAPRAAAFDKRIKVCVANPGVLNWGESIHRQLGVMAPDLMRVYETSPEAFDAVVAEIMQHQPLLRWGFTDMMWKHGASSPSDLLQKIRAFNNESIISDITCQMLIMDSEDEGFSVGEAQRLYEALKSPKDYMLFTAESTGQVHVQTAAMAVSSQRMFDWLDERM